jgi:hypothetical protein
MIPKPEIIKRIQIENGIVVKEEIWQKRNVASARE